MSNKLVGPQSVWEQLDRGVGTARVIVTLNDSAAGGLSDNERSAYLQRVISSFSSQIQVMDVFRYQFGFSARVTRRGLDELVQRREVSRIQADSISRAHGLSTTQ